MNLQRETLAFQTLLLAARQRHGLDESRCRLVMEFVAAAAEVRTTLQRELSALELNELRLGILVVLFGLCPSAVTPADLATHTGTTRSAVTEAIDGLEGRGWVKRERDTGDRRLIYVHLTEAGRATTDAALNRFLETVGRIGTLVPADAGGQLTSAMGHLVAGCKRISLTS